MRCTSLVPSLVGICLLAVPLDAQERALRSESLGEGVYLIASSNLGDPNNLLVVGPGRLLLVDGTFGEATEALLREVRRASASPVRDVVLTHWHPDHTQANAVLRSQGAMVWAHEAAQRRMRAGNPIEYFGLEIPPYPAEALADRTLDGPRTFRLGEEEVRVIPLGPAHTDGDVLIHLPRANVIHLGDLQLGGIYPFVELSSGGQVDGLIRALDQALALADESTVIVPGHGPVGGRADLVAYRALLATVWERVRTSVADGKSLEEVIASAPAAEYDADWSTPLIPTERFVAILYQAATAGVRE